MPDIGPSFSARVRATDVPPIPSARRWAARYRGEAGALIDLTQAVPGYPPHPELLTLLAQRAGSAAFAGYGPIDGDPTLREALAADMSGFYGAPVAAEDVVITAGGNLAFTMTMATLAGQGEAVLLPTPWYFNHRMALSLLGIDAVPLPCRPEDGFLPDPQRVAALLDGRIRALVLVTPNNPTGAVCPPALIADLAALCRSRDVWLVLDETYRDFLPPQARPPHTLFHDPDWRRSFVHLYSFSKAYCVPGHRVGAIVAGDLVRAELAKVIDTMQICPPRAAQSALAWAVPALGAWREANRRLMEARATAFRQALADVPGWRIEALGAYFAYLRLPAPGAVAAAEALAVRQGVLTLPGPFFGPGQDSHLRLAFANVDDNSIAALGPRLARAARD